MYECLNIVQVPFLMYDLKDIKSLMQITKLLPIHVLIIKSLNLYTNKKTKSFNF